MLLVFDRTMLYFIYFALLLCVSGLSRDEIKTDISEETDCIGEEYSYIDGKCYCALEYVPNNSNTKCIKCPGLGDSCDGRCCGSNSVNANETFQCLEGVCQHCQNTNGDWLCRKSLNDSILVPSTQIVVIIIYILGLFGVISALLYKLCNLAKLRFLRNRIDTRRSSVGSLQQIVEERLRDAPPRYSTTTRPSVQQIVPTKIYLIEGFVHDSSLPPPPYTPEEKTEEQINTTLHM